MVISNHHHNDNNNNRLRELIMAFYSASDTHLRPMTLFWALFTSAVGWETIGDIQVWKWLRISMTTVASSMPSKRSFLSRVTGPTGAPTPIFE